MTPQDVYRVAFSSTEEAAQHSPNTTMLVELYLDIFEEQEIARRRGEDYGRFLLRCRTRREAETCRSVLESLSEKMEAIDLRRTSFYVEDLKSLRGIQWFSWGLFATQEVVRAVNDNGQLSPLNNTNVWPFSTIRSFHWLQEENLWVGTDRNEQIVAHMSDNDRRAFMKAALLPVGIRGDGVPPTVWPAWSDDSLTILLRTRFQR